MLKSSIKFCKNVIEDFNILEVLTFYIHTSCTSHVI
jgi:hypothetical protein